MRLTVLGACGAWPEAGLACSGFLVEHGGFRLVLDLGYATVPRLLGLVGAAEVDAVVISHGHPDHCADLNPLLRARAMADQPAAALPVYAPPGALDAVLALDNPRVLGSSYELRELGDTLDIGPFQATTALLPHWLPNLGIRLRAGGRTLAYTGDAGPAAATVALARDADLFLAEATHLEAVPDDVGPYLCSAPQAGAQASAAGVGRLLLTHLWPGTDRDAARDAAATRYAGDIGVAAAGDVLDL